MLAMTGRVTMLGLARWAGKGGSYRTIQRFYDTNIVWAQVFWQFFSQHLLCKEDDYILAGDESVIGKAGKKTYGLDQFFAGLQQKVIPSLSFLTNQSAKLFFYQLSGTPFWGCPRVVCLIGPEDLPVWILRDAEPELEGEVYKSI